MIKWDFYLKFGKRLFSTLLISFFGLLGSFYVNAGEVKPVGIYTQSIYDQSYDIQVISKGSFLSKFLGSTKDVFLFKPQDFLIWTPDGRLYYHQNAYTPLYGNKYHEGYVESFFACDEFTGGVSTPTNCSSIDWDEDILVGFLKTVKSSDYYYYNIFESWDYSSISKRKLELCISSSEVGQSICFMPGACWNYCAGFQSSAVSGSLNFGEISFGQLNGSPSPATFYGGSNSEGSVIGSNSTITGDYVYSNCTYQDIINYAHSVGMSDYICYGGLDNWDSFNRSGVYNPIPGTGFTLSQIYAHSTYPPNATPKEWFDYRQGLYIDRFDDPYEVNISMWENAPAVQRLFFVNYNKYGGTNFDFDTVREFCGILSLNIDYSNTVYNGQYFKQTCSYIRDNGIGESIVNSSGDIITSVNWNGVGNLSGVKQQDAVSFIQDFFNTAKSTIVTDFAGDTFGALPVYISAFLLVLILFRFLSH